MLNVLSIASVIGVFVSAINLMVASTPASVIQVLLAAGDVSGNM